MLGDNEPPFCARPFWFASSELLARIFLAEINIVNQLLAKYPNWSDLLDAPEATIPERTACFTLLMHAKLIEIIDETFEEHPESSPSLDEGQSSTLRRTYNLVAADAPDWVLGMAKVVDQLRTHICAALPEPLREQRFDRDQKQDIEWAKKILGNVEQIHTLTGRVFDQQLQRLERRWGTGVPSFQTQQSQSTGSRPKGTEGLVRKNDLSRYSQYMDTLTEKQDRAFRLRMEYGLNFPEIGLRMCINPKTAWGHVEAAKRKIQQARSSEKLKTDRAKRKPEF